jgi:hypothetical protein
MGKEGKRFSGGGLGDTKEFIEGDRLKDADGLARDFEMAEISERDLPVEREVLDVGLSKNSMNPLGPEEPSVDDSPTA